MKPLDTDFVMQKPKEEPSPLPNEEWGKPWKMQSFFWSCCGSHIGGFSSLFLCPSLVLFGCKAVGGWNRETEWKLISFIFPLGNELVHSKNCLSCQVAYKKKRKLHCTFAVSAHLLDWNLLNLLEKWTDNLSNRQSPAYIKTCLK